MDLDQELHAAIADGDLIRTRLALERGANILSRSGFEPYFTPLLQAAQNGKREIARLLWQRVGPNNAYHDTCRRLSCLEVAARNGHAALVGDFMDVWDWEDDEKGRALDDAAGRWCEWCGTFAEEILLAYEASPNSRDRSGESPLHTIAHAANLDSFQSYLSHCANPQLALKSSNNHGETILHYAAAGGELGTVQLLLDSGLGVNMMSSGGWTPLACALTPTHGKTLAEAILVAGMLLLRGASANVCTVEGWSPLHCLPDRLGDGNVAQLARELVARGADAEAQFEYSRVLTLDTIRRHNLWGFRMKEYVQKYLE